MAGTARTCACVSTTLPVITSAEPAHVGPDGGLASVTNVSRLM